MPETIEEEGAEPPNQPASSKVSICALAGNSMPTQRFQAAAAMVSNVIYVVGGYPGAAPTTVGTLVETCSVLTDTWATGRELLGMCVWHTRTHTHGCKHTHARTLARALPRTNTHNHKHACTHLWCE